MKIETAVTAINSFSAIVAFIAAFLWHRSATIQIPNKDEPDESGMYPASIIAGNNIDFIGTAFAQSQWSKRGAHAAALAAFLQGLALLLQSFAV